MIPALFAARMPSLTLSAQARRQSGGVLKTLETLKRLDLLGQNHQHLHLLAGRGQVAQHRRLVLARIGLDDQTNDPARLLAQFTANTVFVIAAEIAHDLFHINGQFHGLLENRQMFIPGHGKVSNHQRTKAPITVRHARHARNSYLTHCS